MFRQGNTEREQKERLLVCPILSQQFQQPDFAPEMHSSYFFSSHIKEIDIRPYH